MTRADEARIFEDNINLVHYFAHRIAPIAVMRGIDYDTLVQEGSIALLKAIRQHDPARGAWSSYVCKYIRFDLRRMCNAHNYTHNDHRDRAHREVLSCALPGAFSLDAEYGDDDSLTDNYLVGRSDDLSGAQCSEFMAKLSHQDRVIVHMRMEGYSQKEIGEAVGLAHASVWRHIGGPIKEAYMQYAQAVAL